MRIPEERIVPPGTRVNRRCLTKMFPVRFSAYGHTYPSNRAGLRADRSLWTWSKERAQFKSLNTEYTEKSGEKQSRGRHWPAILIRKQRLCFSQHFSVYSVLKPLNCSLPGALQTSCNNRRIELRCHGDHHGKRDKEHQEIPAQAEGSGTAHDHQGSQSVHLIRERI